MPDEPYVHSRAEMEAMRTPLYLELVHRLATMERETADAEIRKMQALADQATADEVEMVGSVMSAAYMRLAAWGFDIGSYA